MDNQKKEPQEQETSFPIFSIIHVAFGVVFAVLLFQKYGIIGAIGGFILGLIPLIGPIVFLLITFGG